MAMIVSDAAAQVQFAYLLAHRGKYTIIEEMIGWNQKFRTFIYRLLPHAVDARRELPSIHFRREIMQVVIHGMEHEIESAFLRILFLLKLLTAVLLITQEELQIAVAQEPGIIKYSLVMMNLLIRHRLAVTLGIVAFRNFQFARFLISFSLYDARSEMIIIECEMRMSLAVVPAEKLRECLLSE